MGSHRAHTLITRHFISFYSIPCLNTTTCMLFLRDYWPDPTFSRCCPIHCNRASRARARTQVFVPQGNRSHWSPNPSRLLSHLRNLPLLSRKADLQERNGAFQSTMSIPRDLAFEVFGGQPISGAKVKCAITALG